jgi:hypothetical protein
MKTKLAYATVAVLVSALALGAAQATAEDRDPTYYGKPHGPWTAHPKFYGNTIGEWSAKWWNWVTVRPLSEVPTAQEGVIDCSVGQPRGKVWFLAGSRVGDRVLERTCTVPKTKALLFPLRNAVAWAPDDCATADECRELFRNYFDVVELVCELDGEPCHFHNPIIREQSPPFTLLIPDDSYLVELGIAAGDRFPSIADGFWVMLPPLRKGEHTLHIKGARGSWETLPTFTSEVIYHLTVE